MSEPVRFGLVGYGFGGRIFHRPLLASAAEVELLGVVTTSAERRALVADDDPSLACFDSLQALVDAGVEAVAISTPAATHTALTEEALRLGLAVVCDKPFALDAAAARATVELAERLGLLLSPYQNRRWDSDFRTVVKLVDDGVLGEVTRLESRFERHAPDDGPGESGAGTLLDFGSHLADQALHLLGPATKVYAEYRVRDNGLDDDVFVAVTHASGAHSQLWGSWLQASPGPRFRVTGSKGTYVVQDVDFQEDALIAGATPASLGDAWGRESEGSWGVLRDGTQDHVVPTEHGAWDTFYPAFARAVRGDGSVPVDPWDAVATATLLDAARRSAITGAVVELEAP